MTSQLASDDESEGESQPVNVSNISKYKRTIANLGVENEVRLFCIQILVIYNHEISSGFARGSNFFPQLFF